MGIGSQPPMKLQDESLERTLSDEAKHRGRVGSELRRGVSERDIRDDRDNRNVGVIPIIGKLVDQVEFKPKVPDHAKSRQDERAILDLVKPRFVHQLILFDLDKRICSEHPAPHDEEVECDAERPFFRRPLDSKDGVEDVEDIAHEPGMVHEQRDQSCAEEKLRKQESRSLIVRVTDRHGDVNDDIPPRDQRGEIVERIIGVHRIGQDNREEIEADQHRCDTVKPKVGFLVI